MGKRKTHEEFIRDFYAKNKNAENIEILGEYKGSQTKIKCRCKLDGYEWEAISNNLLKGYGCLKCAGKIKKTTEEFKQELKEINNDIEILGEYKGRKSKIKCRCKKDNYTWEATPNNLLKGSGCPKCAGNIQNKTTEYFINELKNINNDIEILGEYVNNTTKIKVRCKIDGYEFEMRPNNLLSGQGCPKCAGNMQLTHKEFIDRIKNINNDIEILGKYVGAKTKIKARCKKDGYEWETKPTNLLKGQGCPKCAGNIKKTHKEFINELKEINNDIEILGEYKGTHTKIKVRCKLDGYEWEATPNNLLKGSGCPKCNASKGEKRVAKYLDSKSIKYIHDECYFKDLKNSKGNTLRPDFIIEDKKIWIEYDGEQHFRVVDFSSKNQRQAEDKFKKTQENDKLKDEYAKKHNWKLVRIPYWDFDNIEKILEKEL